MPRLTHGPVPAGTPGAADSRWLGAPETVAAPGAFPRVRWSVQVYRSTVESRRADEALADRNHEQWLEAPTGLSILPAGEKGKFINRLQSLPGVMRLAGVTIRLKDGERGEASSPSRRPGTTDEQEVVEVSNRLERGGLLVGGALRTRMLGGATHDHTEFNDLHLPLNGDTLVLYDRATVDREGLFVFLTPVIERTENDVPRQTFTP